MSGQTTNTIMMIRPVAFRANEQTHDNHFQNTATIENQAHIRDKSLSEFNSFVNKLRDAGIQVIDFDDTDITDTPDSIFPNNWISFHEDGKIVLYPMFAVNRRLERREDIVKTLIEEYKYHMDEKIDYTSFELENIILEGTGSLVLDRVHKKAYCALSHRSHESLLTRFCKDLGYTPVMFESYQWVQGEKKSIYHTNVLMSIAEKFAVICLACIRDEDRDQVIQSLVEDNKEIIDISEEQMNAFAGNVLALRNKDNKSILVMSQSAYNAFSSPQKERIQSYCEILSADIGTIEKYGGGSARCMMCEIFPPL